MNHTTLIDKIELSRREFNKYYQVLPVTALENPDLANGWSVKDLIGHISAWERFLITGLNQQTPLSFSGQEINAFNEAIYQERKDWSWEEIEYESQSTFSTLLNTIKTLSINQLNDAELQNIIARHTFNHYINHQNLLIRWVKRWQSKRRR